MSTDSNDSVAAEFQRHMDMWGEEDSAAHDALEVSYAALEVKNAALEVKNAALDRENVELRLKTSELDAVKQELAGAYWSLEIELERGRQQERRSRQLERQLAAVNAELAELKSRRLWPASRAKVIAAAENLESFGARLSSVETDLAVLYAVKAEQRAAEQRAAGPPGLTQVKEEPRSPWS
jgi:hypothetical protein